MPDLVIAEMIVWGGGAALAVLVFYYVAYFIAAMVWRK
jgi:hypothetical protein